MEQDHSTSTLHKIISLRNINNVVPIISNSFRIDHIFHNENSFAHLIPKKSEAIVEDLTLDEELTRIWAARIHYPMEDDYKLWQVAQYYQVEQDGSDVAKEEYLDFLKLILLEVNEGREGAVR